MSLISHKSRAGSALVISSIVIITIASMAILLTDLTISRFNEQKFRQAQVDLLAATESAANETIHWMKNNPAVQDAMKNMAITSKPGFPDVTKSTSSVLVSTSLPSGLPPVFPALKVKTAYKPYSPGGTQGGTTYMIESNATGANEADSRNACTVETKIIKVQSSATPSVWDDSERFIIYTTAETGDRARPESVRRQRVETVIKAVTRNKTEITSTSVPTPAFPFTRGLFSINGFDFKGTATTDSWKSDANGDGKTDTPYTTPTAADFAAGKRSNGDIGSNGVLGTGAYDTTKVHGKATPNANATLPNVTYNPPTSGYSAMGPIASNTTLKGTSTGTTVYRTPSVAHKNSNTLTIDGSGTVVLYVDGAFNVGNVKFVAGSTAKLVIYQNDIAGRGCSFNAQNSIGDPNDPSRFLFVTAFSGTGPSAMSLNGGAQFSAVVLAPNAGMKMNGGANFYGSFVAKDFSGAINGTYNFHYDESLAGLSWGSVMQTINTETTVQELDTLKPIAWNVHTVGYDAP